MFSVLAKIIPLDLATVLSPGIFAAAIFLLGSIYKPKLKTLAFLAGSLIAAIFIGSIGFFLGKAVPTRIQICHH